VQLQRAPGVVLVVEVFCAVGTLHVRRRLAAHAEVLALIHALGLRHATDGAAVWDQDAVFVVDLVERIDVAAALQLPRGALPCGPCLLARGAGGLEEHVHEKQVLDLSLARGRRGVDRILRDRAELAEDRGEGARRSAACSEALDEGLRSVFCEVCDLCGGVGKVGVGKVGGEKVGEGVRLLRLVGGDRGPAALELRRHVLHLRVLMLHVHSRCFIGEVGRELRRLGEVCRDKPLRAAYIFF